MDVEPTSITTQPSVEAPSVVSSLSSDDRSGEDQEMVDETGSLGMPSSLESPSEDEDRRNKRKRKGDRAGDNHRELSKKKNKETKKGSDVFRVRASPSSTSPSPSPSMPYDASVPGSMVMIPQQPPIARLNDRQASNPPLPNSSLSSSSQQQQQQQPPPTFPIHAPHMTSSPEGGSSDSSSNGDDESSLSSSSSSSSSGNGGSDGSSSSSSSSTSSSNKRRMRNGGGRHGGGGGDGDRERMGRHVHYDNDPMRIPPNPHALPPSHAQQPYQYGHHHHPPGSYPPLPPHHSSHPSSTAAFGQQHHYQTPASAAAAAAVAANMEVTNMVQSSMAQRVYDKIVCLRAGPMKNDIPASIAATKISEKTSYAELVNEYARVNYYAKRAHYATFMTNKMVQLPKGIPIIASTSEKYVGTTFGLDLLDGWDRQLYDSRDAIRDAWCDMYDQSGPLFNIDGRHKLMGIIAQTAMTTVNNNREIRKKDDELQKLRDEVRRLGGTVNEDDTNDALRLARSIVDTHIQESVASTANTTGNPALAMLQASHYNNNSRANPSRAVAAAAPAPAPMFSMPPPPTSTTFGTHVLQPMIHRLDDAEAGVVVTAGGMVANKTPHPPPPIQPVLLQPHPQQQQQQQQQQTARRGGGGGGGDNMSDAGSIDNISLRGSDLKFD